MSDTNITLTADRWKVSATEKVSTGEYENYQPHVSIEGEVPLREPLTAERRKELKARLLALERDAQEIVERTAENRVALPEARDWGVPENGGDDE